MSSRSSLEKSSYHHNPLDVIEDFIAAQEWPSQRLSHDELVMEAPGRWCDYQISFYWQEDLNVLQIYTTLDFKVSKERLGETIRLLDLVNQRLAFGHFEMGDDNTAPAYRYAQLLTGQPHLKSVFLEELMEYSLSECERFYPAFQFTILGSKTAEEAVEIALLDTLGEA